MKESRLDTFWDSATVRMEIIVSLHVVIVSIFSRSAPVEHLTDVPSKYISTFLIMGTVLPGYWTFRFRIVLWINRIKV